MDQNLSPNDRYRLQLGQLSSISRRRSYRARFVKAGRVRSMGNRQSNIEMTENALVSAFTSGLFEGKAVFVDHADFFQHPSLRNLAGVTADIDYDPAEKSILGTIKLYSEASPIATLLDEILAEGSSAPDVGLSMVFWPVW